jgi:hypothetical protein
MFIATIPSNVRNPITSKTVAKGRINRLEISLAQGDQKLHLRTTGEQAIQVPVERSSPERSASAFPAMAY